MHTCHGGHHRLEAGLSRTGSWDLVRRYLEQQQAGGETGHQPQVGPGPAEDPLHAADGEDALTGRSFVHLLRPVATHGVEHRLWTQGTPETRAG